MVHVYGMYAIPFSTIHMILNFLLVLGGPCQTADQILETIRSCTNSDMNRDVAITQAHLNMCDLINTQIVQKYPLQTLENDILQLKSDISKPKRERMDTVKTVCKSYMKLNLTAVQFMFKSSGPAIDPHSDDEMIKLYLQCYYSNRIGNIQKVCQGQHGVNNTEFATSADSPPTKKPKTLVEAKVILVYDPINRLHSSQTEPAEVVLFIMVAGFSLILLYLVLSCFTNLVVALCK